MERRKWLLAAAAGSAVSVMGGVAYVLAETDPRAKQKRKDGKPRLPPGQRAIGGLKPMGGAAGSPSKGRFRLHVHGEVKHEQTIDFRKLLKLPQTRTKVDVHCVTGWTCFDVPVVGVKLSGIAKLVGVKKRARHVIFEAAHGYTANVRLRDAMKPNVMIAHRLFGKRIARAHGAPVRNIVPDLYFWKSAKWLTGIRFVHKDEPGYWETRGYHNHADPWREERYG